MKTYRTNSPYLSFYDKKHEIKKTIDVEKLERLEKSLGEHWRRHKINDLDTAGHNKASRSVDQNKKNVKVGSGMQNSRTYPNLCKQRDNTLLEDDVSKVPRSGLSERKASNESKNAP